MKHTVLFIRNFFVPVLLISIIATASMDLWSVLLYFGFGNKIDLHLVGRWFAHHLQGDFIYQNIPQSAPASHEVLLGWVAHYLIGFVYTAVYYFLVVLKVRKNPTGYTALLFAWATMVFPFFVLQPAMGMGIASYLAPTPWLNRLMTFSFHTAFGLGLYAGCLWIVKRQRGH